MDYSSKNAMMRLPSLRSLYVFEAAGRHLNLVRAAQEVGLTQSALSRQIKSLEEHIGLRLFVRTSRGLCFTEQGDILWHHCQKAFQELSEGLVAVSGTRARHTLHIAVARSYATRVLCHRIQEFSERFPWIDLFIDGHRHLADLERNEADAAIRVGDGRWPAVESERIQRETIFPVAAPALISRCGTSDLYTLMQMAPCLHYSERPYWEEWMRAAEFTAPKESIHVRFSETLMVLDAAETGQGLGMVRRSLVCDALVRGHLVKLSEFEYDDGIAYYFCATRRAMRKDTVRNFRDWVFGDVARKGQD